MPISELALDIGGVLASIDKRSFSLHYADKDLSHFFFDELFNDFQRGKISADQFIDQKASTLKTCVRELRENFLAMLVPNNNINLLARIAVPYKFASNINHCHFNKFMALAQDVDRRSNDHVLSCELGLAKPSAAFFAHLKTSSNDGTLLFIDDQVKNIVAAKSCGIDSVLCESPSDLEPILKSHRLLKA